MKLDDDLRRIQRRTDQQRKLDRKNRQITTDSEPLSSEIHHSGSEFADQEASDSMGENSDIHLSAPSGEDSDIHLSAPSEEDSDIHLSAPSEKDSDIHLSAPSEEDSDIHLSAPSEEDLDLPHSREAEEDSDIPASASGDGSSGDFDLENFLQQLSEATGETWTAVDPPTSKRGQNFSDNGSESYDAAHEEERNGPGTEQNTSHLRRGSSAAPRRNSTAYPPHRRRRRKRHLRKVWVQRFKAMGVLLVVLCAFGIVSSAVRRSSSSTKPAVKETTSAVESSSAAETAAETTAPASTTAAATTEASSQKANASAHTTYAQDGAPAVALTFDDGPSSSVTPKILDVLEQYGAHATFFVLGQNAEAEADLLKREVADGCEIGTHTWDHKKLRDISYEERQQEYSKSINAIEAASGTKVTLIRPPYGADNKEIKQEIDIPIILWSLDTLDWKTKDADSTYNTVADNIKEGDIVLMHDIQPSTAEAIPRIVPMLVERGYKLLTVTELYDYYGENLKLHVNHAYSGPQESSTTAASEEQTQASESQSSEAQSSSEQSTESAA